MLKLYNTLTKKVEEFQPLHPPHVGMYSCGPTVYDFQHIGHMRRYVGDDILVRALKLNGYEVKQVMNITDVGHLVSDADTGEDKMEKGAKKFGINIWELAKKLEKQFFDSCEKLNIKKPDEIMRATDYIKDQIELIEILQEKGYTYKIKDGIYFDTSKFADYTKLSGQNLEDLKAGARVEIVKGKKNISDFALWKVSPSSGKDGSGQKREMEWESPWGVGFPGWHVECSAMSMKALGSTIDIHTGGIDHISIHHTNEIAQSEAASGRQFVKYWVHHAFLMVDNQKMSKSLGNIFTVDDVVARGFHPLTLRYLYLQTHYRQEMNFTWKALGAAQTALDTLWQEAQVFGAYPTSTANDREPSQKVLRKYEEFIDHVNNDLNMSAALASLHHGLKERKDDFDSIFLLEKTDEILGLHLKVKGTQLYEDDQRLNKGKGELSRVEKEVIGLVAERNKLRKERKYHLADQIRFRIQKMGYDAEDVNGKTKIRKIN